MEHNNYQQNNKLFILTLLCLVMSIAFALFGIIILPYLFWGWVYNVPSFVLNWIYWFETSFDLSERASSAAVFFVFLSLALISGAVAYFASRGIDRQLFTEKTEEEELIASVAKEKSRESWGFTIKVLLLLFVIFLLTWGFEWFMYFVSFKSPTGE